MSAAQRLDEVFGLPRGSAVIALNDPETKVPIAIMDGTLISAIRTGAVTGVCAKYMAPSRSKTVGLFGAGPHSGFERVFDCDAADGAQGVAAAAGKGVCL